MEVIVIGKDEVAAGFLRLVSRYGYRRATLDEVAAVCGISKKTVYVLFENKAALYEYALNRWAEAQRAAVEARLTAPDPRGRLAQWVALAFADARAAVTAAGRSAGDGPDEIVNEVNERVFVPVLADLLAEGVERHGWEVADVALAARFGVVVGVEGVRRFLHDPSHDTEAATLEAIGRIAGVTLP